MTSRLLARALVAACLLVVPSTAAAAASPSAGEWTGPVLSFAVSGEGELVSPSVRVAPRRCRALSVTLPGDVRGGRFSARVVRGGARLRIKGRFVSPTEAKGTVRGKLKPRGRERRRGRDACRLRKLAWTASLTEPAAAGDPATEPADEEWADEEYEDVEYAEDEWADEEWTDEDEDPDSEDFWEEETDEEIAAEGDPFE